MDSQNEDRAATLNRISISPEHLRLGDTIIYKGVAAEVLNIKSWVDNVHGKVYGVDLIATGKKTRASFSATSLIEVSENGLTNGQRIKK